jgi:hypothetical protein
MKRVIAKVAEAEREKQAVITKAKGEVVDEWYRVILTKDFNIEKEPDKYVEVNYSAEIGYFPDPVTKEESENESDEVPF